MQVQQTIAKSVAVEGKGLFSGRPVHMTFYPAPANHGVVFVRKDQGGLSIPANVSHVMPALRRTSLRNGEATVDTCEHCLSAIAGLRLDNLRIELDGPELPAMDGSAKPFFDLLEQAGCTPTDAPRARLVVREPVVVQEGDAVVAAVPCDEPEMQVIYELDYGAQCPIGRQLRTFDFSNGDYAHEIAPARTFILADEARELRNHGMGTHLSANDVLVISDDGPLGDYPMRFDDEPVRHKMLDLIGDLYLLGAPIQGRIIAYKSGHALNHELVRALVRQMQSHHRQEIALNQQVIDIRRLSRIMPHRYPMLLVDRVVHIEGDTKAIGIKNVTINEPFFAGHFPGAPIMPGVLIVEAMAQLSGVLIGQKPEHTGKLAVLLSLDRVKLRKPVTPGDQLIIEAEAVKVRSRIAHMRCKAYVGDDLAAEAEVKFMLVDDEQE